MEELGVLVTIVTIFMIVLTVLWIILPFFIVSMNNKLRDLILLQRSTNKQLAKLVTAAKKIAGDDSPESSHDEGLPPDNRRKLTAFHKWVTMKG